MVDWLTSEWSKQLLILKLPIYTTTVWNMWIFRISKDWYIEYLISRFLELTVMDGQLLCTLAKVCHWISIKSINFPHPGEYTLISASHEIMILSRSIKILTIDNYFPVLLNVTFSLCHPMFYMFVSNFSPAFLNIMSSGKEIYL